MIATSIPAGLGPQPYTQRSVSGRDLISIQDFTPDELACALESGGGDEGASGGLSRHSGRQADCAVLREAVAAHAPDV